MIIDIKEEDVDKLRSLIDDMNSFYDDDAVWDFDDLDVQREIGCNVVSIISEYIK